MEFFKPNKQQHFEARHRLLQSALRPDNLPFPIEDEYPLVLDPEKSHLSICLSKEDVLASHCNFFPKKVVDSNDHPLYEIALVGNVATHANFRGQGLAAKLIQYAKTKAKDSKLEAIILWSDLDQFYHKLGFRPLGKEWRFFLKTIALEPSNQLDIKIHSHDSLKPKLIKNLRKLRPKLEATIERSHLDFIKLLKIPNTFLVTSSYKGEITAYLILGKGFDLMNVIHEWGFSDAHHFLSLISHLQKKLPEEEIVLLSPTSIPSDAAVKFEEISDKKEEHPMCLGWTAEGVDKNKIENLFVWGLDSI